MPYAFLNPDGTIKMVVPKPTPFMRMEADERMVRYDPPSIDEEVEFVQPVIPVPADAQEVAFEVLSQPAAIVRKVLITRATAAVQAHMDKQAQVFGYTDMLFAASYAASTHIKFGAEGRALSAWRDACWECCHKMLADVDAGTRTYPTDSALIGELPTFPNS